MSALRLLLRNKQWRTWFKSQKTPRHIHKAALLLPGFLLDERGIKMSKSIGNVVDPRTVMLGGKDQKQVKYTLNPSSSEVLQGGKDQVQVKLHSEP